jgi:two-component system, chemotaxis family, chemotaxis protein CheY
MNSVKKTSILLVDDAVMVRIQVRRALERLGYAVLEAGDGEEALLALSEHPDTQLIICDIHMPIMNGIELLEQLQLRGSSIPVVVLTAEAEPEKIRRAKALGAKAWLVKPLKTDVLLSIVTKATAVLGNPPETA